MTSISLLKARDNFSEVVSRTAYGKERQILTKHGKEVVALVPVEDLKLLEELEDKIDLHHARLALAEAKQKGTVPWDKLKKELGL